MVNAQEWLDRKYPTYEAKAEVKRIGPKQSLKVMSDKLITSIVKGRPLSSFLSNVISNVVKDDEFEGNLNLEGPLSLKGFVNLEFLEVNNQKITNLDISDCQKLCELHCCNNQLTNLDVSNNRKLEQINFIGNQLTNIDFTGLDKIEKAFCSGNKLENLEFLKTINPAKLITLNIDGNKFPARDLNCFARFNNLERLHIGDNPFYGSLKPLRNLTELKELGIARTDIDSGLEYLPEGFFNVNATASSLGLTGGYFKRKLICTGKLAEQLEDYKIENDPLRNYDWQAWRQDNQELINKAKEQAMQEELNIVLEWETIAKEIKELYEQLRCDIYQKTQLNS
jgi:hypothetical protein